VALVGLNGVVFLVLAGTLCVTAYSVFVLDEQVAAQQQSETGRHSLNTVSQQHKPLLYALANDDDVRRTLVSGQSAKLNSKLKDLTLKAGLEALYLMDLSGLTVAASNYQNQVTYVGKNYSFRPYFKDAKTGVSGAFFAIGATTGIPGYFISEPVIDDQHKVIGVPLQAGFVPSVHGYSWKQRFSSLPPALPIAVVVLVIILFVYNPFGDALGTPTEGGALGAFVVLCMAFLHGMKGQQLKDALLESAKLSVMIFSIIWGVLIYVRFLGFADLPSAFSDWITSLEQSPMLTLVFILLAYAVLGMFMDAIGMLLLTLPVVYPAVMALNGGEMVSAEASTFGMSGPMCAIWFGILVVKMAEFCLITPPIGLNCFVVAGVRDDLSVQDVFKGVTPFFIADAITIALLVAFPAIVLWLPSLAAG